MMMMRIPLIVFKHQSTWPSWLGLQNTLTKSLLWGKTPPIAQLAGAVEYTNCFTAEGLDPMSLQDMTLNNLMVRFQ